MRVHVIGGFLGAGKTTAIRGLARLLTERGEKVAVVTNDQGKTLVDTTLCAADGLAVTEIPGGCFCCRYDSLEEALLEAEWTGATVALAEAVGSCTDLVATVLSPLVSRRGKSFDVAPLSVLVDGSRLEELEGGAFSGDIRYLYNKQIEEADVVVLTKLDLRPPDVSPRVRAIRPGAAIVRVSAATGEGMADWVAAAPVALAPPLELDYGRYASAEAELGWANGRVRVRGASPISVKAVLERFMRELESLRVTHVKVTAKGPPGGSANLVRHGQRAVVEGDGRAASFALIVNARAAMPPGDLEKGLRRAMAMATEGATDGASHEWEVFTCFAPPPPVPTHRHLTRCSAYGDPCCPR
jgi:Ni2+-binding GTPase involved in maturation of urease and hydrogenase